MAVLNGAIAASPLAGGENPALSASLRAYAAEYWPPHTIEVGASLGAPLTSALPVATAPRNLAGSIAGAYSDDFYHRIHVLGGPVSAGSISTAQVYTRQVWNAYLTPRTLTDISAPDGVSVTPPAPRTFRPGEQVAYTITVQAEGPPRIEGDVAMAWDGAGTVTSRAIPLSGSRVTTWTWRPDWSAGLVERFEWKTDVIALADAAEQRIDLRLGARRSCEFTVAATGTERRHLEAALWSSAVKAWALPLWQDTRELRQPLPAGSSTVYVDREHTELVPGVDAIIMGDDSRVFESVTIAGAYADRVELANATTMPWPRGARIIPTRPALLSGSQQLARFRGDALYPFRLRFDFLDPWDGTPETSAPMHDGAPVLELRPDWSQGLSAEMARDLEELDALVGGWLVRDRTGLPVVTQKMGYTFTSPAERAAWLRMLALLRGRLRGVWVPTWADDLTVLTAAASSSTELTVAWCGYSEHLAGRPGRRDIRVQLRDGTVAYARVTGAVEVSDSVEQLSLAAPLGINLVPSQVALVSFMALCRNNADAAELSYWTADVCRAQVTTRSYRP